MARKQFKSKLLTLPHVTLWERRYEDSERCSFYVYFNHWEKKAVQLGVYGPSMEEAIGQARRVEEWLMVGKGLEEIKERIESLRWASDPSSATSSPKMSEVVDLFTKAYRDWSEGTHYRNRRIMRALIESTEDAPILTVSKKTILAILDEKMAISATSHNRFLAAYRVFFKWALDRSYIKENPVEGAKLKKHAQAIPEALSKEEIRALIKELSPYAKHVVLLILHTGMRWGEALSLTWDNVDLPKKRLHLPKTKSKTFRTIPLNQSAIRALEWLRDVKDEDIHAVANNIVKKKPDRKRVILAKDIKKGLAAASKRAGIKHVHMHMLRHTFATELFEQTGNLNVLMNVLGHSTPQMSLRYAKLRGVSVDVMEDLEGYTDPEE